MSKLNTLLKYRFVKRDHSKDSGDASTSGSDTQPQSQNSTQPPSTPGKPKSLTIVTNGTSHTADDTDATIDLSSPDSPVFGHRPKLLNKNWGPKSDEEVNKTKKESPWLSKNSGMTNGVSKKEKKNGKRLPSSSDDSSDDELEIEGYQKKMSTLRKMFPVKTDPDLRYALRTEDGDVEKAIDMLTNSGRGNFRRIRQMKSQSSTKDSEVVAPPPRKRIRQMSSGSDDDIVVVKSTTDSQATEEYGLQSQRSDATDIYNLSSEKSTELTPEQIKNIDFLAICFSNNTKKEIQDVLAVNSWNVADATVSLSAGEPPRDLVIADHPKPAAAAKKTEKERKNKRKEVPVEIPDIDLSDEGDVYESGDESGDSDDSIEQETEEANSVRQVILSFFQDATPEELMGTPGCSKKKSDLIVGLRPFNSWESLVEKFNTSKGLTYEVISGSREVIKVREVVKRLMIKCEKISEMMEQIVVGLIHDDGNLEDKDQIKTQPSNLTKELQLKGYQMVGLNWLRIMHRQKLNGILADEMGLGKTIQTIAFLAHLMEEGELGPHVIIVPSSTVDNWMRELQTWCPDLTVVLYYGSQEDRRATRQYLMYHGSEDFQILLTTYNMATGSVEDRALFKKYQFHYAIFDEGHLLKNMSSLRYQNLMRICSDRRLLLTGTPLQNNLLELMSLLCFVMPDIFIGKTEQLKRMFTMISRTGNDEKRSQYEQDRITHAKQIMKPFVLRRLKSEVLKQLPKKTERTVYCDMIQSQDKLYHLLIHNFAQQLSSAGEMVAGGAAMLMQLRKAANHPLLHRSHFTDKIIKKMADILSKEPSHVERGALPKLIAEDMSVMTDFEIHKLCSFYKRSLKKFALTDELITDSGKFRILGNLLDEYKSKGNRVLLFSQFTTVLDIIESYIGQKHIRYMRLDGSTPVPERLKLIDEFNTDKDIFLFLLSTKAGGLGINLTSANVVIIHDIDFNPYNDKQAEDRCHRVGQTQPVEVIRLITKDSVEEAMLKCAKNKLKLERDVTDKDNDGEDSKDVASILRQALAAEAAKLKS